MNPFTFLRYAQVWEDADILLEALDIQPQDRCLSIASAGDNALAMLARGPREVVAIDMNPAQLAALELRVAAFRRLDLPEIRALVGAEDGAPRREIYARLREDLSAGARAYWDARPEAIAGGIGHCGKFENYFRIFRERVVPLIHSARTVGCLLTGRDAAGRAAFYEDVWNTWRWRLAFRLFFSRTVMGRLGRDPSFFRHVEGSVADRILARTRHALTVLDPCGNPYLQWILRGRFGPAWPFYLREENFAPIRKNLDRLRWCQASLDEFLAADGTSIDKFNLSDIFEYMPDEIASATLRKISAGASSGARLAYWNMLAPRCAPPDCGLVPLGDLARRLHAADKAFFYSAFVVEEAA